LTQKKLTDSLNGVLPKDIRILETTGIPDNFDSRKNAIERSYIYKIITRETALERRFAYSVGYELDIALMQEAAVVTLNQDDFTSFCKTNSETENKKCHILISEWSENGDYIQYNIAAVRFVHHMVRSLVGTMIDVGRGKINITEFEEIFDKSDRQAAGPNAPAHGLYLERVVYPDNLK